MKIIKIPVGQLEANCFLVFDDTGRECRSAFPTIIIDPGDDADLIYQTIIENKLKPVAILATHGHFDHVMAAFELQENFQIPFYIDRKDQFLLDRLSRTASHFLGKKIVAIAPRKVSYLSVETIHELSLPKPLKFKIIPISGHTPGSVSLYFPQCHPERSEGSLFIGDLMFAGGGVGRTDFDYCSFEDLKKSIGKIMKLPKETKIYCGHGQEWEI